MRLLRLVLLGLMAFPGVAAVGGTPGPVVTPPDPSLDPVEVAIDHVRNLEYDDARLQLESWVQQRPGDLKALNYLASAILQRELFQRDLLESRVYTSGGEVFRSGKPPVSPGFEKALESVLTRADSAGQERLRQNPKDELALYWLGSTHATRAIYHLAIQRAVTTALAEVRKARDYHAQVLTLNPNCVDAMLIVGIYDYVIGSLPWYVRALASIAGYRGDKARGLAAMERVAREGNLARAEAQQFLGIFYYREKRYAEAIALLDEMARAFPRNFIIPQEKARTYKAQGNWRLAAVTYDQILARYHEGDPGYREIPITKILYQAGEAHSNAGEKDLALRLYLEAARREQNDIFVYRAELAAASVFEQHDMIEEARRRLERVAQAVPTTDEGKSARQNLKRLPGR